MILIRPIQLPVPGLALLQEEAEAEGYHFLDTLTKEWTSGENRFDGVGEMLCGHFDQGLIVAVGGLNYDPFLADPAVGRIRRVYVRKAWRNRGIGTALVQTLVIEARKNFRCIRLRAENPKAAQLYESLGFEPITDEHATHSRSL